MLDILYNYISNLLYKEIDPNINPLLFPEIRHIISSFLNFTSIYNLKSINKECYHDFPINQQIISDQQVIRPFFLKLQLEKNIYQYFKKSFLPISLVKLFPILSFRDHFLGLDYIDNIQPKNLKHPIMIGVDCFKRPFISLRYKFNFLKEKNKPPRVGKLTLFQRYSNNYECWVKCNDYGLLMLQDAPTSLSDIDKQNFINNLVRLITDKPILCRRYHLQNRVRGVKEVHSVKCELDYTF